MGPKFGVNAEGIQIHIHTRLEHSRSNSNKIQLCNFFQTLTSVTLKSRSNPKPVCDVVLLDTPPISQLKLQPLAFKWQKSGFQDGRLEATK
jgi:hypothetical protein